MDFRKLRGIKIWRKVLERLKIKFDIFNSKWKQVWSKLNNYGFLFHFKSGFYINLVWIYSNLFQPWLFYIFKDNYFWLWITKYLIILSKSN
jgi:hypothetical protein